MALFVPRDNPIIEETAGFIQSLRAFRLAGFIASWDAGRSPCKFDPTTTQSKRGSDLWVMWCIPGVILRSIGRHIEVCGGHLRGWWGLCRVICNSLVTSLGCLDDRLHPMSATVDFPLVFIVFFEALFGHPGGIMMSTWGASYHTGR